MTYNGKERRKTKNGRRFVDNRLCPYHEFHEKQIAELVETMKILIEDLKGKISFRVFSLVVMALIAVAGLSVAGYSKYIDSQTAAPTQTLKENMVKCAAQRDLLGSRLEKISLSINRIESNLNLMNYRLDQLDKKTPENHTCDQATKKPNERGEQ